MSDYCTAACPSCPACLSVRLPASLNSHVIILDGQFAHVIPTTPAPPQSLTEQDCQEDVGGAISLEPAPAEETLVMHDKGRWGGTSRHWQSLKQSRGGAWLKHPSVSLMPGCCKPPVSVDTWYPPEGAQGKEVRHQQCSSTLRQWKLEPGTRFEYKVDPAGSV